MEQKPDPQARPDAGLASQQPPSEAQSSTSRPLSEHQGSHHDQRTSVESPTHVSSPDVDLSMTLDGPSSTSVPSSAYSNNSEHQLGHGGRRSVTDPSDRVFPIRSVVSVDHSHQTPWAMSRDSGEHEQSYLHKSTHHGCRSSNVRIETEMQATRRAETTPHSAKTPLGSPTDGPQGAKTGHSRDTLLSLRMDNSNLLHASHRYAPLPLFNDAASSASEAGGDNSSLNFTGSHPDMSAGGRTPAEPNENLVTARFKHVMTDEGHAVITGRDGNLQRCEDEPIHTPGAVQSFGLLVALREETSGRFSVRIVSENSKRFIGYSPQHLFQLGNFMDIFTEIQAENLLDHIDFIRDDETDPATNGPEVFSISIRRPNDRNIKLWCAIHIPPSHADLIVCEFELEDDEEYPLRPPDEMTPPVPEDTLYQNPTLEEFSESTEIGSKPLRVLRSARKKRGEAGAMQVFDIMSQVQEQLAGAPNLEKFLKILVGIVKELTGFHRVMIYQFDSLFNGKVVTELVDPIHTRDLYKGLNFPASDIPRQARELYKLNKVRLLYDRDLESARLVCRTMEDLEKPLDMSHAYLRAMSPIHLKYLGNMAVRASMSISINAFNELWGLIACHSYGPRGMRVPFPIRKMCRLVGDTASRNIERLSYASRLQARKLINTVPTEKNPSGYIIASSDDLLKLFDADFGMLSIGSETKIMGKVERSQEALAMLEYLRLRKFTSVLTTQDIRQDLPDLRYPPGFSVIAGLLFVPLSVGGQDFIVFFRKGQIREVKWAGNPYEKVIREGTCNYLEPRASFQVWHETVLGKCRDWSEEQIETAAVLCLVYGKFIEVWRQKEAALQSSRLTRLLLANSAHEVRTPLNAIINYLEIALEGSLDQETRDNLARSHSASKSLIYVINDLLDLTKTEEGQELVKDEVFDLPACLREATEPFKVDAKRKGLDYEVIEHPGLPRFVHGDHPRVRQAIANMTANAFQHTVDGFVKVECYVVEVVGSKAKIEIMVQDTGCGMNNDQLDALFRDLEQVETADDSKSEAELAASRNARTLGLGLAVVARIVRNTDGQLRLKSDEGKGSRFVIQFPFEIPSPDVIEKMGTSSKSSRDLTAASVTKSLPPAEAGEVMLVKPHSWTANSVPSNVPSQTLPERRSFDETNSVSSFRSGGSKASGQSNKSNKSDADRLIDAIQMPLSIGEPEPEATFMRRQSSNHSARQSASLAGSLSGVAADKKSSGEGERAAEKPPSRQASTTTPSSGSGMEYVTDTKTPIKAIKVPDDFQDHAGPPQPASSGRVLYEISAKSTSVSAVDKTSKTSHTMSTATSKLQVLIAEDDPINMKILRKRLEKAGHDVSHTVNGEDCATVYSENPQTFDVILMDMQMPIVDGLTSTKMIRAFEKSGKCPTLSTLASLRGRVPIFAVSASLVERERLTYIEAGFDGWILKPIDFRRLHTLLDGITDDATRTDCLYVQGDWERGGWFGCRDSDPFAPPLEVSHEHSFAQDLTTPTGPTGLSE